MSDYGFFSYELDRVYKNVKVLYIKNHIFWLTAQKLHIYRDRLSVTPILSRIIYLLKIKQFLSYHIAKLL